MDWPTDLDPYRCEFFLRHNTTIFASPITRTQQVLRRQGEQWVCTAAFHFVRDKARSLDALLSKLKGSFGTVHIPPWPNEFPIGVNTNRSTVALTRFSDTTTFSDGTVFSGGTGDVVVFGDYDVGAGTVMSDGWYPNLTVLKAGDHVGIDGKLYLLSEDLVSDAVGMARMTLAPRLQTSPVDGTPIIRTRPLVEMRLVDDDQPNRGTDYNGLYEYSLSFVEAL